MQISTKGNGNLVRVRGGFSYPGLELTGLYCISNFTKNNLVLFLPCESVMYV